MSKKELINIVWLTSFLIGVSDLLVSPIYGIPILAGIALSIAVMPMNRAMIYRAPHKSYENN